jgi:hypothetical protein
VSHFVDDPPGYTHQHPDKENKSKEKEFVRQSGRVITPVKILYFKSWFKMELYCTIMYPEFIW